MIADRLKRKPVVVSVPQQPAEQQVQEQQPQQTQTPPAAEKQETGSLQGVEQPTVSQTTTPAQPEIQGGVQSVEQIPTEQPQITSYADIIGKLNEGIELTPEEKKREARNKLIAGVGDAISSIANLVAVNRGAKNAYTPTLSSAYQQYYDKMQADRDARRQEIANYYYKQEAARQKAGEAARDQYNKDRDYRFKVDEAKRQAEEDARKAGIEADKLELQRRNIESIIGNRDKDAVRKDKLTTAQINKYNVDAAKAAAGGEPVVFAIGTDMIEVPKNVWNEANINKVFKILESKAGKGEGYLTEEEAKGAKKMKEGFGGLETPTYTPYTPKQKMELIGKYMNSNPEVANAIRELAGMDVDFSAYEDDTDTEAGEVDATDYSQYKM